MNVILYTEIYQIYIEYTIYRNNFIYNVCFDIHFTRIIKRFLVWYVTVKLYVGFYFSDMIYKSSRADLRLCIVYSTVSIQLLTFMVY